MSIETHIEPEPSRQPTDACPQIAAINEQIPANTEEEAAQRQRNEAARRLLQEWLADESGYDEEVWPQVKQLIEENRLSPRKRFSD